MPVVISARPSVSCSSAISTVTPVTMTITPHGMRAMAFDSSTVRSRISADATIKRDHADVEPEARHGDDQRRDADTPSASAAARIGSALSTSAASARAAPRRNSFQPPSSKKPPKPTSACASALYVNVHHS